MSKAILSWIAVLVWGIATLPTVTHAGTIERKLMQFGLEPRFECDNWKTIHWPWPAKGSKEVCLGGRIGFLQHEIFLVINGPGSPEEATRKLLEEAGMAAISAGVGTFMASPSPEPFTRAAAAASVAKSTFMAYLSLRGLEQLASQYKIEIQDRTSCC
ncbi:hypothetical protein V5F53_19295 [Xanthobacter sp. V4C-4]|uniref:hypothetical protein n=1 Tax=Xanthobacter cornucopiae TaxID=3119924 RepID=UPI003729FEBE